MPVTVKTRIGWSDEEINILDFARRMEDAGADMITIHGRTRQQGYSGKARWDIIAQVKEKLSIPVIANGDIFSVEAAVLCMQVTNADGVMCSRGTLGYPFLVGEIDYFFRTGKLLPSPTLEERLQCAKDHLRGLWEYKGQRGILQARKHLAWYCEGFPGARVWRDKLSRINSLEEGLYLLDTLLQSLSSGD